MWKVSHACEYPPLTLQYKPLFMFVQPIVDEVKRSLAEHHEELMWRQVTMPDLDVPWVGMNVPALDTGGRPWVWEVVTPDQYASSPRLQEDPLVLPVAHDTVVAEINHFDHTGPIMRMQVPVRSTPDSVVVHTGLSASSPWSVRLQAGWTAHALGSAAQCWIDREAPGTARLQTPEPSIAQGNRYQLNDSMDIESGAFDLLLTLNPDDAAVVTSLLNRVRTALSPYR
jgi:hypothetical protein